MTTILRRLRDSTAVPKLLNNADAARVLGISPNTLRLWRHLGQGPRYVKLGHGQRARCAYDLADIEAWLAERKFTSTSAATVAADAAAKAAAREAAKAAARAAAPPVIAPWLQPTV